MVHQPATILKKLQARKEVFGEGAEDAKLALLASLRRKPLKRAADVLLLHEWLCFARAFPDGERLKSEVERWLAEFHRRSDLKRHRVALADTGVVTTDTNFRFFWQMAKTLVPAMPNAFSINWEEFENADKLPDLLSLLLPYTESPALDAYDFSPREWIQRLKGPGETDAAFLLGRFLALDAVDAIKEHLYDSLDVPLLLSSGEETPCRTTEIYRPSAVHYQTRPLSHGRPDLKQVATAQDFRIRDVDPEEGRALIALANRAMVPRHRDLLVFLYGDENDVRVIDFGDGLEFVCIGTRPERRLMLEAVYGFLTLRNGVVAGYILNSALFHSCELAYNVFETFRGAEAAAVYGRFVSAVHHLFAADSFTVDPYQMGRDNAEGQASGAWWFYYKLGFRPRDPEVQALVRAELTRMKRNSKYRSSPERIHELAAENMYLSLGKERDDVLGSVPLGDMGLAVSAFLAKRFGGDRERGLLVCAAEAAELLGVRRLDELDAGQRTAFSRFAPFVIAMPEVLDWSPAERDDLREVILAKGGRRESDFVLAFDRHTKLRKALLRLAKRAR